MSMIKSDVKVVPKFDDEGNVTEFESKNLKIGDEVQILKHPALSFLSNNETDPVTVSGTIIAEDKWHFTARVRGKGGDYNVTLNKSSLYAKDPRYISEVIKKIE